MNNLYTSIDLKGGLGNQLFQIAYIIYFLRLSKRHRIKRKLIFKSDEDIDSTSLEIKRKTYWNTLFKELFRILNVDDFNNIPLNIVYSEIEQHKYNEPPYSTKNNIMTAVAITPEVPR
jgi:hypothetical protein